MQRKRAYIALQYRLFCKPKKALSFCHSGHVAARCINGRMACINIQNCHQRHCSNNLVMVKKNSFPRLAEICFHVWPKFVSTFGRNLFPCLAKKQKRLPHPQDEAAFLILIKRRQPFLPFYLFTFKTTVCPSLPFPTWRVWAPW